MCSKPWFYGKNIVITGTSSGIGFHLAKLFATKYACNVYGLGRNVLKLENGTKIIDEQLQASLQKQTQNGKSKIKVGSYNFLTCDVSSFESFSNFKKSLDEKNFKVDIVINNAGVIFEFDRFENQDLEKVKKLFEINFYSHLYSYKLFSEDLKQTKGMLVNISSSSALCPIVGQAVYSASKGAIKNFTEAIRVENKKDFKVLLVCPGFVKTDLFREQKKMSKLVQSVSMNANKASKKIVRAIAWKKRRVVIGFDSFLMNSFYKFFPRSSVGAISGVLKASHDPTFEKVYSVEKIERKEKV